jgi:hypothetical protein
MNTSQELAEQAAHEKRLETDIEYAIDFRKQEIYEDLVNFQEFMADYQMYEQVARELLRALCNIDAAMHNKHMGQYSVIDALSNIKDEIDAKIANTVRNK